MDWLVALFTHQSVAHAVIVLAIAVALGLILGKIRVGGVGLGVGGVLFSGLILGHFHLSVDPGILAFVREFGLILFVYAIGLQVGPGFFASIRKHGLTLNTLAIAVVLLGTLTAVLIGRFAGLDFQVVAGLLSGATTNTPSLGAAQQAFADIPGTSITGRDAIGLGYAVTYPFGIVGVILVMLILRRIFRINPQAEAAAFDHLEKGTAQQLICVDFRVTNENLAEKTISQLGSALGANVVISRIFRDAEQTLATASSVLKLGDVVQVVGSPSDLQKFAIVVGHEVAVSMPTAGEPLTSKRIVVTKRPAVGHRLEELDLPARLGVVVTRVTRSGVEFTPTRNLRIQFGDRLRVVGTPDSVTAAAQALGDSIKDLNKPDLIPIFVGIGLGILVGSIPFAIPHIPAPVKLGFAGGPLIVAILMGRLGKIGPIISYMPNPAKELLKDFGIALFLASVGLKSGERLVEILVQGDGLVWMGYGMLVTFLPLMVVGIFARGWLKMNFTSTIGILAGSMTDPPALAYATQMSGNDAPSLAYATVYPLTMLLRVLIAQVIILVAFT